MVGDGTWGLSGSEPGGWGPAEEGLCEESLVGGALGEEQEGVWKG